MPTSKEQKLLAQLEIESLVKRERYCRDTWQWEKLRGSWHPDTEHTFVKLSWYEGDIDGFIDGSRKMAEGGTISSHGICPVDIHFSPSFMKAVSESTGTVTIRFEGKDGNLYEVVSWVRFISRLKEAGEDWKISSLEPVYERDAIIPVVPVTKQANDQMLSFRKGERTSYSGMAWLLSQRGFTVAEDLAGSDRPETVQALMSSYFKWLAE